MSKGRAQYQGWRVNFIKSLRKKRALRMAFTEGFKNSPYERGERGIEADWLFFFFFVSAYL